MNRSTAQTAQPTPVEMAGYLIVPHERVPLEYNAGYSMYVTAWPLLETYPGNRFQTGLFSTWMFAQKDASIKKIEESKKLYSDIEGGLGWWRDTRFATETPKFIMGGVALNFSEWANGPGAGKGRDWEQPKGKYAIAQLSPWVVWPPDGLNLKQGTCNQWFGYGYTTLPLATPKSKTAGADVPTGGNCWTLFLNTGNFKGPVTFFAPYFWSRPSVEDPSLAGIFLDSRMANPNKSVSMETQHIPGYQATDSKGVTYARVAPTSFPKDDQGNSPVMHQIRAYKKSALHDSVKHWFDGGEPADTRFQQGASVVHKFKPQTHSTWKIYSRRAAKEDRPPMDWRSFAQPVLLEEAATYGYRWDDQFATHTDGSDGPLITLPEYYRLTPRPGKSPQWIAVAPAEVPAETGLADVKFNRPRQAPAKPYETPEEPNSSWKTPGPVAGPFTTKLGDGSVVTYYWYRFADQPALLNADLTEEERESMQSKVEKLHRHWTKDREYLPPPTSGELADLDPALLVTPPRGYEIGYVPIATRQEAATDH